MTGYKPFTIRQACNTERVDAEKRPDGCWRIHRSTVVQLKDQGLPALSA